VPIIIELLTFIYNLSFQAGIVPGKLKHASIAPIHMKDQLLITNFHPIYLVSVFHKRIEEALLV
jgi:hypothetical protein